MSVTVRSFAKINLGLRIGARRQDGFHDLLTVYQTIGLHDVIRLTVERGSGIEIHCTDSRVPYDESNTCHRIVEKALSVLGAKGRVLIEIEKRLPVQGGLGGASSNAVAALIALERALKKNLSASERLRIAREVGSDLPLFLIGGTVLGIGRGEEVYPLEDLSAMACVVVTPEVGVSTPKAFVEWDRRQAQGPKPPSSKAPDAALKRRSCTLDPECGEEQVAGLRPAGQPRSARSRSLRAGWTAVPTLTSPATSDRMSELSLELSAWLSESFSGAPQSGRRFRRGRAENLLLALVRTGIQNDFEQVVLPEYPELSEAKRALEGAGAKYASLSGSGSALYGLFARRERARLAARRLRQQGWEAQETVTLMRRQYWKRIIA